MSAPLTFEQWMREVNNILIREVGMDADFFEDWNWHDAFSEEATPMLAVADFINDTFPPTMRATFTRNLGV